MLLRNTFNRNHLFAELSMCCGSVISVPQEMREYIGSFQRMTEAAPLRIDASGKDEYPPSRITDLRVEVDGNTVSLTWSAPGGDFDSGKGNWIFLAYTSFLETFCFACGFH